MQSASIDTLKLPAWNMPKGSAQTFYARSSGVLQVHSGRIWLTMTASAYNPQPRWKNDLSPGDVFLLAGDAVTLQAGQQVVMEAWPHGEEETTVRWEAAPVRADTLSWQASVVAPLHEAGAGTILVARALMRVLAGLTGYAGYFIAGRGKVLSALESNAP